MELSPMSNYRKKIVSCCDMGKVPRSPVKWNWNWLSFLPFIFSFDNMWLYGNFVPFPELLHNPCYFSLHLTLKENLLQAPSHSLKGKNEKRAFDFFRETNATIKCIERILNLNQSITSSKFTPSIFTKNDHHFDFNDVKNATCKLKNIPSQKNYSLGQYLGHLFKQ